MKRKKIKRERNAKTENEVWGYIKVDIKKKTQIGDSTKSEE